MAKTGKHKSKYERYKNSGHREENKIKRQERHNKRIERFDERRIRGKSYIYSKEKASDKFKILKENCDSIKEFERLKREVCRSNVRSNRGRHTSFAKETSVFRKLENTLKRIAEEERLKSKRRKNVQENYNRA